MCVLRETLMDSDAPVLSSCTYTFPQCGPPGALHGSLVRRPSPVSVRTHGCSECHSVSLVFRNRDLPKPSGHVDMGFFLVSFASEALVRA